MLTKYHHNIIIIAFILALFFCYTIIRLILITPHMVKDIKISWLKIFVFLFVVLFNGLIIFLITKQL